MRANQLNQVRIYGPLSSVLDSLSTHRCLFLRCIGTTRHSGSHCTPPTGGRQPGWVSPHFHTAHSPALASRSSRRRAPASTSSRYTFQRCVGHFGECPFTYAASHRFSQFSFYLARKSAGTGSTFSRCSSSFKFMAT